VVRWDAAVSSVEPHRPEDPVLGIGCVRGDGLMAMDTQHRLFTAVWSDVAVGWGRGGLPF